MPSDRPAATTVWSALAELALGFAAPLVEVLLVPVAEQHPGLGGVTGRGLDELTGDLPEPAAARPSSSALLHDGRAPALRAAEDLVEQMLLPAEMTIDRAFGHARPGSDRRRGGGTEAYGGIQLECCSQQPLAGGFTVAAGRLGSCHIAK